MNADIRRNIEIKARCSDLNAAKACALQLGASAHQILEQIDTYFSVQRGRLKLRQQTDRPAQLIWYERSDATEARSSNYRLIEIADPDSLIAVLTESIGQRGQVRKHREVMLWKNVRIHLDQVEQLGTFLELEAVIDANSPETDSHQRLNCLCDALKINAKDRVGQSYSDLLGI